MTPLVSFRTKTQLYIIFLLHYLATSEWQYLNSPEQLEGVYGEFSSLSTLLSALTPTHAEQSWIITVPAGTRATLEWSVRFSGTFIINVSYQLTVQNIVCSFKFCNSLP